MEDGESKSRDMRKARLVDIDLVALSRTGTVHFVGIGGTGMSALATLLLNAGGHVSGCDIRIGEVTNELAAAGAQVVEGHDVSHVERAAAVVATAAVPNDHPELLAAKRRGIPVLKRAQALGSVVNRGTLLAVAGTHGKSTTTSMAAEILAEAGMAPTAFVGGRVPGWSGGLLVGGEEVFVVEADEYDRSFLTLRPQVAVVTTVEADHLDVFGSLEAVEDAFREFVSAVPQDGQVIGCTDDPGAKRLLDSLDRNRVISYGLGRGAQVQAVAVESRGRGSRFVVLHNGEELGQVKLAIPGLHNVRNALGALTAARSLGAEFEAAQRALGRFRGVGRRFQELGRVRDVLVIDDYAHHPTEIQATLSAARQVFPENRLVAVFQPHLFSRTRDFAEGFGRALAEADVVFVTDVYPAREAPIPGVTGELVARAAAAAGATQVHYQPRSERLGEELGSYLKPGDVCITLGAGDIDVTARALLERLKEPR